MDGEPGRPSAPIAGVDVAVIVPALDEEECIGHVVKGLLAVGLRWVIVVDNGSSDATATAAQVAGAQVVYEPQRGYGAACWAGMRALPAECAWVLFCGGDGQDVVAEVPRLIAAGAGAELVIGVRSEGRPDGPTALSTPQLFGNALACSLIWAGWGGRYRDLGPLRLVQRGALDRIGMQDRGFGWTVEMQVRAIEEGLSVAEVPVFYQPRLAGASKISGTVRGVVVAGSVILWTLGRLYTRQVAKAFSPPRATANAPPQAPPSPAARSARGAVWLGALLLLLGAADFPRHIDPSEENAVAYFFRGCSIMCLGYALASVGESHLGPEHEAGVGRWLFWWVAVQLRMQVLLLQRPVAVPGDDVYRFIWEGHVQNEGFNPYQHAPASPALEAVRRAPAALDVYKGVNHPHTSAVYPPLAELFFRALSAVTFDPLAFKGAFTAADLGVVWLLQRRWGRRKALAYAWSPLAPISWPSGGHHDPLMVLAQVSAWLAFEGAPGFGL